MPVTCGCVPGCVCPAEIVTDFGEISTKLLLLVDSVTVTPPAGAAADKVIGNGTDWLCPTVTPDGRLMDPNTDTVTGRVADATFGAVVLAVTVAEPAATPCTRKLGLVVLPAPITTLGGTVATAVLLD